MLKIIREAGQAVVCDDLYVWVTKVDHKAGTVELVVQESNTKSVRQIKSLDTKLIHIATEEGSSKD